MAVEEKQTKKSENTWSNPFSGRYEPFVDEKGFGKFHLFNLNSTKQISLDGARTGACTLPTLEQSADQQSPMISRTGPGNMGIRTTVEQPVPLNQEEGSGGTLLKEIEDYKKLLQGQATEPPTINTIQDEGETVDPNDPLVGLIKQINHLKQQRRAIEQPNSSEPCPNVNPFPLASLLQPSSSNSHSVSNHKQTSPPSETSEAQKQLLQQRLIDRIKGAVAVSVNQQPTAVTTLTNSPYISPIPAVRLEPSPKTGLQMKDVSSLDSDNIRLLRLLIPNFSQSGGTPHPNYTALPVNQVSNKVSTPVAAPQTQNTTVFSSSSNGISHVQQQQPQQTKSKQGVVMDNDKCLEMFQNIRKQISDQSVFNLTATIHQTSNETEGLILVVTRNKIDIHPQFGPIHVARVVITNKLYYKFFVLDKVVNSGQVGAKEISEVFWKLSEVSQHLLCPGFNQRYISKVEQTLGEKVEDITTSYCRLTAKLCTVWHQKDSKPGQCRNYHTRDLCSECLDLYHRLQFKTYSHTKLKQQQQQGWQGPAAAVTTPSKREQEQMLPSNQVAKKPKLNGQQYLPLPNPSGVSITSHTTTPASSQGSGGITEQQLKAVLSNLVNSRVVQVTNKECDGDDLVDICGEDSSDVSPPSSVNSNNTVNNINPVSSILNTNSIGAIFNAATTTQPSLSLSNVRVCSASSLNPTSTNLIPASSASFLPPSSAGNIVISSSASILNTSAAVVGETRSGSPNVDTLGCRAPGVLSVSAGVPLGVQSTAAGVPPNIRVIPNTTTQTTFVTANGSVVHQSPIAEHAVPVTSSGAAGVAAPYSKIDDILASLNELQKSVPDLISTDSGSVDEGIRNLLKQFQKSDQEQPTVTAVDQQAKTDDVPQQAALQEEGAEGASLGDSVEDSRSQGEDLLVIQED